MIKPLRYVEAAVTMAEVPNEISLTLTISNCINRCHGCHSSYLWQDVGNPLLPDLGALIRRYRGLITCVCLMGEGQNPAEQETALRLIRNAGLKTCQYSGCENIVTFTKQLPLLDYLKTGPYIETLGGLDSPKTNQRFFRVDQGHLIDETHLFQRKKVNP